VRFHARNPRLIKIAASVLVPPLLASCIVHSGTAPYPNSWTPIRHGQTGSPCPKIAGVYQDRGDYQPTPYVSGRPCSFKSGECRSLIFGLLSDAQSGIRIEAFKWRSTVQQVQIEQPSPGVLEIIAEPGGNRQTLSMANGDFTCDGVGLRLRDKTAATIVLISNMLSTESRIFNVAEDGSLVMKSEWHNQGHHLIFPASVRYELWVRWTRVDPEQKGSQTVTTQPPNEDF